MILKEFKVIFAFIIIATVSGATSGSGPQLNTFRVAPSSSSLNDANCCGGTNTTYPVACGIAPRINLNHAWANVAAFGEFPWQVAIVDAYDQKFLCSGVLLSQKTVLTAAHCVSDIPTNDLRVRVGEWDILSDEDPRESYQSVEIPVSKKYFHPDMDLSNDRMSEFQSVSLLKLRSNVNFGELPHVAPACLPAPLQLDQQLPSLRCFVAGWSESPLQPLQTLEVERRDGSSQKSRADVPTSDNIKEHATTRLPIEPTPKPCISNNGYEDAAACYAANSARRTSQQRQQNGRDRSMKRSPSRNNINIDDQVDDQDDMAEEMWSRILGKAQVRVVPREECLQLTNEVGELDSSSLCLFPAEEYSHPCQADIGGAVMCEMPYLQRGKRTKDGRDNVPKQFVVVGIVTRSYSCNDISLQANRMQQQRNKPVVATSILRILNHVCKVAGTIKK